MMKWVIHHADYISSHARKMCAPVYGSVHLSTILMCVCLKECDHNLCKPDYNLSIKFKIQLVAM